MSTGTPVIRVTKAPGASTSPLPLVQVRDVAARD